MGWDAGSIESRLDVDTHPFHDGLERAKAEAREFADHRYTTTVDINTKRSQDELAAVEQRLHSIESTVDRIGTKTGGGGGGGRGGVMSRLAKLPNPSWMALGIGAAIPAAVPFAGAAAGLAGGALSAGATGLLGLGAFGLGAKQNVATITGDITKLNKLTAQYNAATTNKQRAAVLAKEDALWKALDPAQRAAVRNVQALDTAWGHYKKKLEPQTFAVVADGAKIANTGLKYLLPTAHAVGDEIDSMLQRAEKGFKSPFWHQFFGQFLPGEAARSVDALGTTLGNLGTGVAHLVQDFSPLAHILEGGSTSISGRFEKWTEGAGPGKFVAWVEKEGPPAGKALESIAKGVKGLAEGFAPIGQLELKALTPILNFLGDLGNEHPAVITALGGALLTVAGGLKAIALVKGAAGIVGALRGGGGGLGGGGGIIGKLGSKTPVPVYVTNWGGGSGGPGLPGGKPSGGDGEGDGLPKSIFKKALPFAGVAGRALPVVGLAAASAYTVSQMHDPKNGAADIRAFQKDPAVQQRYKELLADYEKTHPASTLDARSANITDTLLRQAIADVKGYSSAVRTSANDIDNMKSSLAHLRSEFVTLGPQVMRSLNGLVKMPTWLHDAEQAALNGGTVIGKNLADGITIGLQQGNGKVQVTAVSVVKGALHAMSKTAVVSSPSKITTQYGRWIAEGLAVGFTGYQATLEKTFSSGTKKALGHIGNQLNNAANQYRSDLQARSALSSQISGGLMSGASIANANLSNTGGATVGGYLAGQVGQLSAFKSAIDKLRAKRLDPRLIQQISDAGPQQGLALAQSILSGESIHNLNVQEKQVASLSGGIGSDVAGSVFGGTLASDRKEIARLATAAERLLAKQLHLSASSSRTLAREIATEFNHAMPYLNLKQLGHAGAIRIYAAG